MNPIKSCLFVLLLDSCMSLRLTSNSNRNHQSPKTAFESSVKPINNQFSNFSTFWIHKLATKYFKSQFFADMMSEIRNHAHYVPEMKDANIIFIDYDSLRQCIYPSLSAICKDVSEPESEKPKQFAHVDSGVDENFGQNEAFDVDGFVSKLDADGFISHAYNDSSRHTKKSKRYAHWRSDTQIFMDAVSQIRNQMKEGQVVVYFANINSWGDGLQHQDIQAVRTMEKNLGIKVIVVGIDLVNSANDDATAVNLLMPLLPKGQFYEMGHMPSDRLCTIGKRKLLVSFMGQNVSAVRSKIFAMHNESAGIITSNSKWWGHFDDSTNGGMKEVLLTSKFGFAPRGDAHYSFRLTEVLAAGAVPVIMDDEAMPPYGTDSFKSWAVVIPESEAHNARQILESIQDDTHTFCSMQMEGRKILEKARDMHGTVGGMLAALEQRQKRRTSTQFFPWKI